MCTVEHSYAAQNHSLIKELNLCVKSFLLPLLQSRLSAWPLARKPLKKLAKPLTQWLLTLKRMLKLLPTRLLKLLTRPLKLPLTLLKPLKALLTKQPLPRKMLPSNFSERIDFSIFGRAVPQGAALFVCAPPVGRRD